MITIDNKKQCGKCKEWKRATNEFFGKSGLELKSRCKTCRNSLHIKWQKNNADKCSVNCKKWYAKKQSKSVKPNLITIDNQKQCTKCKEWKRATNEFFGNNKAGSLYLEPYCKSCTKSKSKSGKRKNLLVSNVIITIENEVQCTKCKEWKQATNEFFSNHKSSDSGLKTHCKKCAKNYMGIWCIENKERLSEHKHKRRALIANAAGTATAEQIKARFQFHENRCYYCGDNKSGLHVEHRIPLSRGGSNWPSNLVPACPTCNLSKHTKTEKEFLKS